ncbi:hypothetical protein Aduo_011213 [Ancylostoma duodenale]
MPQDSSSKIRRQIGFFKKLIQRNCASLPQTLTDYDIDEKHPKFDRLDEDQLESLRLELHNIRLYGKIGILENIVSAERTVGSKSNLKLERKCLECGTPMKAMNFVTGELYKRAD